MYRADAVVLDSAAGLEFEVTEVQAPFELFAACLAFEGPYAAVYVPFKGPSLT